MASMRKLDALGLLLFALVASVAVSHGEADADFLMKRGGSGGRGVRFTAPHPAEGPAPGRPSRERGEAPETWEEHEGGGKGSHGHKKGSRGGKGSHAHGVGKVKAPTPGVGRKGGPHTEGVSPRPAKGGHPAGAPHGKRILRSRVLSRGRDSHAGGDSHPEGVPRDSRSGEAPERAAEAPCAHSGKDLERGAEAPRPPKTSHRPGKSPKGGRH